MESSSVHNEMLQLVTFKLSGQKYAVDILKVREINNFTEITYIPDAPPFLEGVINLRGKVIPVLNLKKKFGFDDTASRDTAKIVIIDIRGVATGLIVDSVSDVLRISSDVVESASSVSANISTDFIAGIAKLTEGLVMILDLNMLLDDHEHSTVLSAANTT